MLSRFIQSGRGIFGNLLRPSGTPRQEEAESLSLPVEGQASDGLGSGDMVSLRSATRGGAGAVAAAVEDMQSTSNTQTPKRKRNAGADGSGGGAAKRHHISPKRRGNDLDTATTGSQETQAALAGEGDSSDISQMLPLRLHGTVRTGSASSKPEPALEPPVAGLSKTDAGNVIDDSTATTLSKPKKASASPRKKARISLPPPETPIIAKAQHKRFTSEEYQVPESHGGGLEAQKMPDSSQLPANEDNDTDEDEDEAPEAVSTVAGQEHARQAAVGASQAAQRQAQVERERRQAKESKLKDQQRTSKSKSKKKNSTPTNEDGAHDAQFADAESHARAILASGVLPDMLPDDILRAASSAPRRPMPMPTPPPEAKPKMAKPNKKKLLDANSKPLKDVKVGSTVYRFLEQQKRILAPKVSKSSRNLREQWLSERSGGGPGRAKAGGKGSSKK